MVFNRSFVFGCSIVSSLFLAQMALLSPSLIADDWPQFRGAEARGVADHPGLPERWSETENILWKKPVEGRGWSSPVVADNKIFVTTVVRLSGSDEKAKPGLYFGGNRNKPPQVEHQWKIICFRLNDGKELWQRTLHHGIPKTSRHIKNSYASETPVTDGKHVYVLFGDVGLYCLTTSGKQVWSKPLPPCKTRFDWGTASSPILYNEKLIMVSDNEDSSYLAAFNKQTGKQIWKVSRDEKSNWATPFIWKNSLRTEIVVPGSGKNRSYNLDGKLLYEFAGSSSITIANPYTAHGLLYVTSGYILDPKKPIFAIRPGASGDISLQSEETSNKYIAWCQKKAAPYNPSTIVYRDQLYVLQDRGFFTSFNATTGEPVYGKQRLPEGKSFTTSPWASNGKIFCLNEFGETFVIKAGRQFELLHTNKLDSKELCMATPAIVGRKIILRTGDNLYCISKK